jgi:hypothetical protein
MGRLLRGRGPGTKAALGPAFPFALNASGQNFKSLWDSVPALAFLEPSACPVP